MQLLKIVFQFAFRLKAAMCLAVTSIDPTSTRARPDLRRAPLSARLCALGPLVASLVSAPCRPFPTHNASHTNISPPTYFKSGLHTFFNTIACASCKALNTAFAFGDLFLSG